MMFFFIRPYLNIRACCMSYGSVYIGILKKTNFFFFEFTLYSTNHNLLYIYLFIYFCKITSLKWEKKIM